MKKYFALLLVIILCAGTLSACGASSQNGATLQSVTSSSSSTASTGKADSGKLFDEPVKVSMMMLNHESWPYQETWFIKKAIEERTNIQLIVDIPGNGQDLENKVNLSIAGGEIPDLIFYPNASIAQKYGPEGAFANVMDHMSELPNFKKWYEANNVSTMAYMTPDGALYMFPNDGMGESNRRGYLYRKDIFEKHKLSIPKNEEELYNVLKELKKLYPDSYPFVFRGGLSLMTESWGSGWNLAPNVPYYYNSNTKQWNCAVIEENYKNMCVYFYKLYQEELIPKDYLTLQTNDWQDLIATEKGFITCDYLSRIDGFNTMVRGTNPDFTMAYMPPIKGGANGSDKMAYTSYNNVGFMVSAKSKNLDKILKYMDWFYTDEAKELVSWGKEGETYEVNNGQKKFIGVTDMASMRNKYGLSTNGFYLLYDFDAQMSTYTDDLRKAINEDRKYDLPIQPVFAFSAEDQEILKTTGVNVDDYYKENISKFLIGERPFSEWDQYVSEMKKLGVDQILELYKKTYKKLMK